MLSAKKKRLHELMTANVQPDIKKRSMRKPPPRKKTDEEYYHEWETADRIASTLQDLCDRYAPVNPCDPINPVYKKAIDMLPDAINYANEKWLEYIGNEGDENV